MLSRERHVTFEICVISDHRAGQHFIIPEMADSSLDMSELAKAAKKKLQAVSDMKYILF